MSSWIPALVAGLVVCQLAILLTTLWLHRALAHRALTVRPWLTNVFRVLIWITTGLRPRQWVAVHRLHHAYTDVEGDPHSPVLLGTTYVQVANVALYRRAANNPDIVARYAKDLPADRWDRVLFDHALLGLSIGIGILVLLLGVVPGLMAAAIHTVSYLALSGAINALGHAIGKRPNPNTATNLQWLALITAGEGLHNNHHAVPTSPRLAMARREIDPAWWVIRTFQRFGWVTLRQRRRQPEERVPVTSAA